MSILKKALSFLICIILLLTFASCGGSLSGKYVPDLTSYEAADTTAGEFYFDKNGDVTYTPADGSTAFHGEYTISQDTITFRFEEEGCRFEGTFSFKKKPGTVTIDGYTYANGFHNLKTLFN
ncbi:MAG: hypothetical protein IJX08_05905 [Clostridia bacterium]|nr:hypothetical protein [Clostridia bacterium]MBQ8399490.1 hypothetical protein [Clostridia bacterium]